MKMRERGEIEREIEERRDDLAQNIEQLKDAVLDKVQEVKDAVNVPKRAREAVAAGKDRVVNAARERPLLYTGIAVGALMGVSLVMRSRRRARQRLHASFDRA